MPGDLRSTGSAFADSSRADLALTRGTSPVVAVQDQALAELSDTLDVAGALSSVEETAYVWNLETDQITWEDNAASVLGIGDLAQVATGQSFNMLVAPEHYMRRLEAIGPEAGEDLGHGVPFRLQYRLGATARHQPNRTWLEEQGRWWAGRDGKPARARGMIRVVNEGYREQQRKFYRSDLDELTGQLNRTRLTEALRAVIERSETTGQTGAFLIAAVNTLSAINETFGFEVGDEVIASVARTIRSRLRGADMIGRYSSNKFGIILNDCGPGAMRIAADRFLRAVRDVTVRAGNCPVSVTISMGGVLIPAQANSVNAAVSNALQALEVAKTQHHDCFQAFEPSASRETSRRRSIAIADEIVTALDEHRMLLVLQPIVCSRTRKPKHYEALLRMERRDGSICPAGEFIPVAEQLGLSRLIDLRALELAVDLLHKHPTLHLTVNVSGLTCSDHEWLVSLHRLTGGKRAVAGRLTVEITETAAIHDLDQSIAFVDTVKEIGCKVAIDDFGAGYTSFKNLKHLAADMVKIDGVFVKDLAADPTDKIFIKTLADLAVSFGMETVAEWVGDAETAAIVEAAGITYMQGFHFGRPIPAAELDLDEEPGQQSAAG